MAVARETSRWEALFAARTRGIGVLPRAVALSYGVSGPVARASGVDMDLRRDDRGRVVEVD